MRVCGIDFTSAPGGGKAITCLECRLEDGLLQAGEMRAWRSFDEFEAALQTPGPWIAGIDFPFGQSSRFIQKIGWSSVWHEYVDYVATLSKGEFEKALKDYKRDRPRGDREHRRATDDDAKSLSPQKLYGVPVGKMFFQGAPRLRKAGVFIPGLQPSGDQNRIVVEAYPGVLARKLIGDCSYKHDTKNKQTDALSQARYRLWAELHDDDRMLELYGLRVKARQSLADDPTGDEIDALLCAVQAAWAWLNRERCYGMPNDSIAWQEGWIADPMN